MTRDVLHHAHLGAISPRPRQCFLQGGQLSLNQHTDRHYEDSTWVTCCIEYRIRHDCASECQAPPSLTNFRADVNMSIDTREYSAHSTVRSHMSQESHGSLLDDDVDLMSEVAEGIIERDRRRMRREVLRWLSFVCAVLCW